MEGEGLGTKKKGRVFFLHLFLLKGGGSED